MANTHSTLLANPGSNHRWEAADSASLSVTGSLTIECWVRMTNLPPNDGGEHRLVIKGGRNGETNTRSYRLDIFRVSGNMKLQLNVNSSGSGSGVGFDRTVSMSTGVWYHIAAVFDAATGEGKIYLDGVQQGATATGLGSSIADTSGLLSVGGINWGGSEGFDGDMDEVRIWSTARSQAEISANKNTELVGNESGLNAYYKFNNNGNDSTSNGNTLTAINSVGFTTDVPPWSQTFNQAVTATAAVTSSVLKGLDKTLTATSTVTASMVRQMASALTATATVTASIIKQMAQALDATSTITASILAVKVYLEDLFATTTVTSEITKIPGKLLEATSTTTASVAKALMFVRTVSATATVTSVVTKAIASTLSASASVTASLTKVPGKLLSAGASVTATISNSVAKLLEATSTVSAQMEAGRAVMMEATATVTSTIVKTPGKLLSVIAAITAKVSAPFWRVKYPAHGDGEDYDIKYPHE